MTTKEAATTVYTPIRIGRSDGEEQLRTKKHGREENSPSKDQLDRVANPDDYYELVSPDDPLAIEWKRQLGGLLQKERGVSQDQKWLLMLFPENYRLYKQIISGKDVSAFLYGYPLGHKKRYKSAYEFFPHLMWLAEGKSDDYGDCSCKLCAPDWVQKIDPLPGRNGFVPAIVPSKKEAAPVKKDPTVVKKEAIQVRPQANVQRPSVVIKERPTVADKTTKVIKPPTKAPIPATTPAARPAAPTGPLPTPLPAPRSAEQAEDAKFHRFIYRPGEVTWFNRGTAWGLSVILSRSLFTDAQGRPNRPRYVVQPLSHPFHHPEVKTLSSEDDLRPWLAWSAPNATHQPLINPQRHYNNIDWEAVVAGRYGAGDAEVDGSIFAARMIDDSFTLIELLSNNNQIVTTGERSYNAIFLGGEKLWVGEPIRLRINQGQDIMIIHHIVEKLKPGSTDVAKATVFMIGDIYRFTTASAVGAGAELAQGMMAQLPLRMKEDLDFRNRITVPKKRTVGQWRLAQAQARLGIQDVKGRWYESSVLLPILHGAERYNLDVSMGEISDVGNWINGREDANLAGGRIGTRIKDRMEAFGRAVPEGTRIGNPPGAVGKQESGAGGQMPTLVRSADVNAGTVGVGTGGEAKAANGVNDGDIAEFMDLDRMEDGFAKDFVDAGGGRM